MEPGMHQKTAWLTVHPVWILCTLYILSVDVCNRKLTLVTRRNSSWSKILTSRPFVWLYLLLLQFLPKYLNFNFSLFCELIDCDFSFFVNVKSVWKKIWEWKVCLHYAICASISSADCSVVVNADAGNQVHCLSCYRRWSKQDFAPSIARSCKYFCALYRCLSAESFALVAFGDLKISINYNCLLYIPYIK